MNKEQIIEKFAHDYRDMELQEHVLKEILEFCVNQVLALDQPQEEIEEIALFDIAKHLYSNYAKTIEDKLNEVVREINKINNKIK